jgi:hypothetical protein
MSQCLGSDMRLRRRQILIVFIFAMGISAAVYAVEQRQNWHIKVIKNNVVYFFNGQRLQTGYYDIKLLGELPLKQNSPLYIFSGVGCKNCDEEKMVFLMTPGEKTKLVTPEYAPYDYPGREYSSVDSALLYESRMFIGNVLPNVAHGIIWYQTMLDDDNQYHKSAYLVKIENGELNEDLIFENVPAIENTLALLKNHKCKEIAGVDSVMEP